MDYDLSDPRRVRIRLSGKILDENYIRLLISKTDLRLMDIIALDKVQKKSFTFPGQAFGSRRL